MTGGSFFVIKRRYAGSRREKLYTYSLTSQICSNTYEFFQIFLIFEIFFFRFETQSKVMKCYRKKVSLLSVNRAGLGYIFHSFFFTHAITILSLFTYSVCDEKVKKDRLSDYNFFQTSWY